ncbi:MAG TPA: GNAT family N-acetyltransferase [Opitutaceae bacterium]|nr:GNAT family N-acetyltransferase [Opitutaceae bacterium]
MANKNPQHAPPRRRVVRVRHARHRPPHAPAAAAAAPFDPAGAFPPAPPEADPHALEPREVRFGGQPHWLRPLAPADADRLIAFFNSHTEETIRQRYGYHISEMTPERARRLVGVDQARDVALGVFERTAAGDEVLHAVGRYLLDAAGRSAEMAFVVRESKRHLGIATALLRRLLEIARQRGMGYLFAQVQGDNAPMLAIFRRHGGRLRPIPGADAVEVFVPTVPPRAGPPGR